METRFCLKEQCERTKEAMLREQGKMLKGKRIKTIIALLLCFIMTFGSSLVIMADNTQQATESQETDGDSGESSGQQDSGSSQETSDGQTSDGQLDLLSERYAEE